MAKRRPNNTASPRRRARPDLVNVRFELTAGGASAVYVTGTFNGWHATACPLQRRGRDSWSTELALAPGTYEYRFVVDGLWTMDPMSAAAVPNIFGGMNSILVVPAPV